MLGSPKLIKLSLEEKIEPDEKEVERDEVVVILTSSSRSSKFSSRGRETVSRVMGFQRPKFKK